MHAPHAQPPVLPLWCPAWPCCGCCRCPADSPGAAAAASAAATAAGWARALPHTEHARKVGGFRNVQAPHGQPWPAGGTWQGQPVVREVGGERSVMQHLPRNLSSSHGRGLLLRQATKRGEAQPSSSGRGAQAVWARLSRAASMDFLHGRHGGDGGGGGGGGTAAEQRPQRPAGAHPGCPAAPSPPRRPQSSLGRRRHPPFRTLASDGLLRCFSGSLYCQDLEAARRWRENPAQNARDWRQTRPGHGWFDAKLKARVQHVRLRRCIFHQPRRRQRSRCNGRHPSGAAKQVGGLDDQQLLALDRHADCPIDNSVPLNPPKCANPA